MAELTTIARPYAQAVFKLAQESKRLKEWGELLGLLAAIVETPEISALIGSPKVSPERLQALLFELAGDRLDQQSKNFLRLLVENRRLAALPEIARIYHRLEDEAEKRVEVEMVSAFEVRGALAKKIAAALAKRLGKEVEMTVKVDERLIGGAVIRAGDLVIDGSVAGELDRLARELTH